VTPPPSTGGEVTYVLPIVSTTAPSDELTAYLRDLSAGCRLVIVDGSSPEVFALAHAAWSPWAVHVAPDPRHACVMGKVQGVLTGLDLATTDEVIIADDDVRYTPEALAEVVASLRSADVVVPQNYFDPVPWHARWDTGRTLLNRVTGGDFPGTLGVRASTLRAAGGYDGDVMFENLELMRTVEAAGGTCRPLPGVYVRRLPPSSRHFASQRVRQAYDELARPARLSLWLLVGPLVVVVHRRRPWISALLVAASVGLAEVGRRRHGGRRYFPFSASLMAPLWVCERAVCVWLAMAARLRGGVRYRGRRIRCAAHSTDELRTRRDSPLRQSA
jgi:hypothetical protein